jgi:hypothetical protein
LTDHLETPPKESQGSLRDCDRDRRDSFKPFLGSFWGHRQTFAHRALWGPQARYINCKHHRIGGVDEIRTTWAVAQRITFLPTGGCGGTIEKQFQAVVRCCLVAVPKLCWSYRALVVLLLLSSLWDLAVLPLLSSSCALAVLGLLSSCCALERLGSHQKHSRSSGGAVGSDATLRFGH